MDLYKALQELADEIKDEILKRLRSPIGNNPRTGTNTLVGSELERSIDVRPIGETTIVFEIADYYEYVVSGWRRTGNFPHTSHLFIRNVTDWVRRKNVTIGNLTENQIAWMLYRRMVLEYREIQPRPFIESGYNNDEDPSKILNFLDEFFNKWADRVFELITKDLDNYFT